MALAGGRVLIVGGLEGRSASTAAAIFDPISGTATALPGMNVARSFHSATLLADGRVLIAGGWSGSALLDSLELFDPIAGSFELLPATLMTARASHTALSRPDGSVAILGGQAADGRGGEERVDAKLESIAPASRGAAGLPAIETDRPSYSPGDTLSVTGSSFLPGETVVLLIDEEPLQHPPYTFSALADAEGRIADSTYLVELHGQQASFRLTARGATSGASAVATFVDAALTAQFATGSLGDPNQADQPTISVGSYFSYPNSAICAGGSVVVPLAATLNKATFATVTLPAGGSVRIAAPATATNPAVGGPLSFNVWTAGDTSTIPSFATGQGLCIPSTQANQFFRANYRPAVGNAAPTVTPPPDQAATEGIPTAFNLGLFADSSLEAAHWTATIDWGDGTSSTLSLNAAGPLGTQLHSYPDDGRYQVVISIADAGGLSGSASFIAVVANANPRVGALADQAATEGVSRLFPLGSFSDSGANDGPWTVSVDWGDGSSSQATSAAGPIAAAAHTYSQAGVFNARVTVKDKDGGAGSASFAVSVSNVAPAISGPPAQAAVEGAATAFALGSFADAAGDGPWATTIDWGDGTTSSSSQPAAGAIAGPSHRYPDNGNYQVTVSVKDAPGLSSTVRFTIAVTNAAPVVSPPANQVVQQRIDAALDLGSFGDAGANDGPWSVAIDWGDGTVSAASALETGALPRSFHNYQEPGAYLASVKVTDKDGGAAVTTFQVVVLSSAPSLAPPLTPMAIEGTIRSYPLGSLIDPTRGPWAGTVSWGDGTQSSFTASSTGNLPELPHVYLDNGSYPVAVAVKNALGLGGYASFQAVVLNADPVVAAPSAQAAMAEAAATFDLGSFVDLGAADASWTVQIDWGDGSAQTLPAAKAQGPIGSATHLYHLPGTQTVRIGVTDKDGGSGQASFAIAVSPALEATIATGNGPGGSGNPSISIPIESVYSSADCSGASTLRCTMLAAAAPGCADPAPAVIDLNGSHGARFLVPQRGSIKLSAAPTASAGALLFAGWTTWAGAAAPRANGLDLCVPADAGDLRYRATYSPPSAPLLVAAPNQSANEGASVAFALGSFSDPAGTGPWAVTIAWGDGSTSTLVANAPGPLGAAVHAYADNGNYPVSVGVAAHSGLHGAAAFNVAVANVAPTATLTAPASIEEGASFLLALTSPQDPSSTDRAAGFRYAFDCGDGSGFGAPGTANTRSCATTDDGVRLVRGRVFDKDNGFTETSATVAVRNVAPRATFSGPATILEGGSASFAFTNPTDPSPADIGAKLHYAYECGGGSLGAATYASSGSAATVLCAFDDGPATKIVRGRIIDQNNGFTEYTASIQVVNVAPVGTLAVLNGAGSPCGNGHSCDAANGKPESQRDLLSQFPAAGSASKPALQKLFKLAPAKAARGAKATLKKATFQSSRGEQGSHDDHGDDGGGGGGDDGEGDDGGGSTCKPVIVGFGNQSDPSHADTVAGFHYAFDCNGYALTSATYANSAAGATKSCSYPKAGFYSVRARIIDKNNGYTESTVAVIVGGHMTGDGSLPGGVSHSFNLRCDPAAAGALEVTWAKGKKDFVMTGVTSAVCTKDSGIEGEPHAAYFNTLTGSGTGKLNGVAGYSIKYTLTDGGGSCGKDHAQLVIKSPAGVVVLSTSANLTGGDQAAHDD